MAKNDQPKRTRDFESSVSARAVTAAKKLMAVIAELDDDLVARSRVCGTLRSRFGVSFPAAGVYKQEVEEIECE